MSSGQPMNGLGSAGGPGNAARPMGMMKSLGVSSAPAAAPTKDIGTFTGLGMTKLPPAAQPAAAASKGKDAFAGCDPLKGFA
jgi:hypothetical protein